jgi:hypothetical protein
MSSDTRHFYSQITPFSEFSDVGLQEHYHEVPSDWDIVLTDIEGSTKAIEEGRYKDVNALGAASIISVTNAMRKLMHEVEVPFVFGGDGATLLIPRSAREAVSEALARLGTRAIEGFGLSLRMGIVPMEVLHAHGERVLVSKHQLSEFSTIAMFSGGGVMFAESLLKDEHNDEILRIEPAEGVPDLEGFECRWHPVPTQRGQIVSILVMSTEKLFAQRTYSQIVKKVDEITNYEPHPLNTSSLKLSMKRSDFRAEALLRTRSPGALFISLYQYLALIINTIGAMLLRSRRKLGDFNGDTYLDEVVVNTDYRKFDDTLRLTLDLNDKEYASLKVYLDDLHLKERIVYGVHVSDSAQITCMIESHNRRHLHFIDGTNGGYASAAIELKRQIKESAARQLAEDAIPELLPPQPPGSGPTPTYDRAR